MEKGARSISVDMAKRISEAYSGNAPRSMKQHGSFQAEDIAAVVFPGSFHAFVIAISAQILG
jgi:hypothetical protein